MSDNKMTPEQIANWRKILPALGIMPQLLSDDDIQRLRDNFQRRINADFPDDSAAAQPALAKGDK